MCDDNAVELKRWNRCPLLSRPDSWNETIDEYRTNRERERVILECRRRNCLPVVEIVGQWNRTSNESDWLELVHWPAHCQRDRSVRLVPHGDDHLHSAFPRVNNSANLENPMSNSLFLRATRPPWIGCRRVWARSATTFEENPCRKVNRLRPVIRMACGDDEVTWTCHSPI